MNPSTSSIRPGLMAYGGTGPSTGSGQARSGRANSQPLENRRAIHPVRDQKHLSAQRRIYRLFAYYICMGNLS